MEYQLNKIINDNGKEVFRFEFANVQDLESFFVNLIGKPAMASRATKAIGNVLFMWEKNQ